MEVDITSGRTHTVFQLLANPTFSLVIKLLPVYIEISCNVAQPVKKTGLIGNVVLKQTQEMNCYNLLIYIQYELNPRCNLNIGLLCSKIVSVL